MRVYSLYYPNTNSIAMKALHSSSLNTQNKIPIQKTKNKKIHSINFRGYYGDIQPLKKMFWINTGRNIIYEDNWTKEHLFTCNMQRWINAKPNELLTRTPEQVIQSVCTLIKPNKQYPGIPSYIPTPNFGSDWGRTANYIEINPRLVAKYDKDNISDGLLGVMRLLPAIPPSGKNFANCIILSQLYPSIANDGKINDGSLYCTNLHNEISKNLTSRELIGKMGSDEQVKAFNDLAHLLGLKTGFRMPLSAGQLKIQGRDFDWKKEEKAYIDACKYGIELGFDAIYFDSCKHVIDKNGYVGIGNLPDKQQLSWITYSIRNELRRNDLSFIGEKCNDNDIYREIGMNAGTDWGKADNINSIQYEAKKQANNTKYAGGPEVSNDNDDGAANFETRLNRINSCLWGHDATEKRLPSFMQLHDIFPLSPYINTHQMMMEAKKLNGSEAWTECERHWSGIFNTSNEAEEYRLNVYHQFENYIKNT